MSSTAMTLFPLSKAHLLFHQPSLPPIGRAALAVPTEGRNGGESQNPGKRVSI